MAEQKLSLLLPEEPGERSVVVGRYVLHRQIARGGMATIHIARLTGDEGFSRIVAVKRLHPEFAEDSEFVKMFLDEARIASRVHHRNVVPVLDVVAAGDEVILVQEYVHGAPLGWLLKNGADASGTMPISIVVSIVTQVLSGLHATHETVDEMGHAMQIVHRDVSPQNVMVSTDGSARLLDFGVAKAVMAAHVTREGTYKGKLAYSAPEQLRGAATSQSDIYSLSVMFWELLVGERMHRSKTGVELVQAVVNGTPPTLREALTAEGRWDQLSPSDRRQLLVLDPIVRRGLAVDTKERWSTAAEMERAIMDVARPATLAEVSAWLKLAGKKFIDRRDAVIAAEEASWRRTHPGAWTRSAAPAPLESFIQVRGAKTADADANPLRRGRSKQRVAIVCGLSALGAIMAWTLFPDLTPRPSPPALSTLTTSTMPAANAAPSAAAPKPAEAPAPVAAPAPAAPLPAAALAPAPIEPHANPIAARQQAEEPREKAHRAKENRPKPASHEPSAVAAPPAASGPSATANEACAIPYYFEGTKKVFKPECL